MGKHKKLRRPASSEQIELLEQNLLLSLDSLFKQMYMDKLFQDAIGSTDDNLNLDKDFLSSLVSIHSNICYSLLCLCVLLRADFKATLPVEKRFLLRRIVVVSSELYKYLYTFTNKRTEWKDLLPILRKKHPDDIDEIERQSIKYQKRYGQAEDKIIRDVSKHYSSNPIEFYDYVSKINEQGIVERALQLMRFAQPINSLLVEELKDKLKSSYDWTVLLANPKVNDVTIDSLDTAFAEKITSFVINFNKTMTSMCQTIHNAERFTRQYGVDLSDSKRWKLFTDDNIVLHTIYISLDFITLIKAFASADSQIEKRQILAYIKVSMHEGLKKLYGFTTDDRERSLWNRFVERSKPGIEDAELLEKISSSNFILQVLSEIPFIKDEKSVSFLSHVGYVRALDEQSSQTVLKYFSNDYDKKELSAFMTLTIELNNIYGIAKGIIENEKRIQDEETEKEMNKYLSQVDGIEYELLRHSSNKQHEALIREQSELMRDTIRKIYRF